MVNILSFLVVANIAGVHIKMDTSKGKLTNVHIENRKIIHLKACAEGIFYANLNDTTVITHPTNFSLSVYYYLSTVKKIRNFLLILKSKERRKFESYNNIFTGQERQILILTYDN